MYLMNFMTGYMTDSFLISDQHLTEGMNQSDGSVPTEEKVRDQSRHSLVSKFDSV